MKKNTLYFYYFKHLFFVLVIMAVVIVGLSLAFYSFFKSRDKQIEVPALKGMSIVDAIEMLQEKGLKPYIMAETSDTVPIFYVTTQQIPAKFMVKEGRDIVFSVSIGQNWMELPDFTEKNVFDIQAVINAIPKEKRKFYLKDIIWVDNDKPFGTIVNQEPKKSKVMDQSTGVYLFASNGEGKRTPALKDKILHEALYILGKEKLKYKIFFRDTDDASQDNRVIEQIPAAALKIIPGGVVTLTIAKLKSKQNDYATVDFTVPEKLNQQKIKLIYRDNRGDRVLFEGIVIAGEQIIRVEPVYGAPKCDVYQFENGKEKLFSEIKL